MTRISKRLITLFVVLHQVARRVDAEAVDTGVQPEAQDALMEETYMSDSVKLRDKMRL